MHLTKVESGLLEKDNFFLTSEFGDFLGDGVYNRSLDTFNLESGEIERRIDYPEFLIVVNKEPTVLGRDDRFEFYLSDSEKRSGVEEVFNNNYATHWKLAYSEGFIQGYKSLDGENWSNVGGVNFLGIPKFQGFSTNGPQLTLKDYQVYRSPYITIQNFYPGSKIQLKKPDGSVVKERLFGSGHQARIFLDYPGEYCFEIFDPATEELLYTSEVIEMIYGDVFLITDYLLDLYYKGVRLTHETTTLATLVETVELRNASGKEYFDIPISVNNPNTDEILISLDNENFSETLIIPSLEFLASVNIYIKIIKDKSKLFKVNEFSLEIG